MSGHLTPIHDIVHLFSSENNSFVLCCVCVWCGGGVGGGGGGRGRGDGRGRRGEGEGGGGGGEGVQGGGEGVHNGHICNGSNFVISLNYYSGIDTQPWLV